MIMQMSPAAAITSAEFAKKSIKLLSRCLKAPFWPSKHYPILPRYSRRIGFGMLFCAPCCGDLRVKFPQSMRCFLQYNVVQWISPLLDRVCLHIGCPMGVIESR